MWYLLRVVFEVCQGLIRSLVGQAEHGALVPVGLDVIMEDAALVIQFVAVRGGIEEKSDAGLGLGFRHLQIMPGLEVMALFSQVGHQDDQGLHSFGQDFVRLLDVELGLLIPAEF